MSKTIIKESQLREIIKESIKNVLKEWDDDEVEDWRETPECFSRVTLEFNAETLEIGGSDTDSVITISSNDFPDAYSTYDSGDYWTPPYSDESPGACGGDFEVEEIYVPDEYEDRVDEIERAFLQKNEEEILDALSEKAEFC